MTDTVAIRPVPRWVRVWAILTVLLAAAVVVLGGLVTSFRVGMSDPVWPTAPWFLATNNHVWIQEPAPGFLIEHTHRLVAWAIGVFATVLAIGAWASEPNKRLRWFGVGAILFLLVAYLALHGQMGEIWRARQHGGGLHWPVASAIVCGIGLLAVLAACIAEVRGGSLGRWVRVAATIGLVGVMIQGLLGGYRVFLGQLMAGTLGIELAAIHGTFAQVVFCILASLIVLSAPRRPGDSLPVEDQRRLRGLSLALPLAVFVQLIWGVWVRHMGSPVAQRLHILTAFLVTAIIVWLIVRTLSIPAGRRQLGFYAYHLLAIVAVQVMLGVEAWMGKFAAAGPQASIPPMLRPVSREAATIRTAHVLIGTALLAASVLLALRVWRKPLTAPVDELPHPETTVAEPAVAS